MGQFELPHAKQGQLEQATTSRRGCDPPAKPKVCGADRTAADHHGQTLPVCNDRFSIDRLISFRMKPSEPADWLHLYDLIVGWQTDSISHICLPVRPMTPSLQTLRKLAGWLVSHVFMLIC